MDIGHFAVVGPSHCSCCSFVSALISYLRLPSRRAAWPCSVSSCLVPARSSTLRSHGLGEKRRAVLPCSCQSLSPACLPLPQLLACWPACLSAPPPLSRLLSRLRILRCPNRLCWTRQPPSGVCMRISDRHDDGPPPPGSSPILSPPVSIPLTVWALLCTSILALARCPLRLLPRSKLVAKQSTTT